MRPTIDFGVDLGTSNSAIALQEGANPRLLPGPGGDVLVPSAIHVRADGRLVLGEEAAALRASDPANTAIEFKRQMGTNETTTFPASGRCFCPVELSAEILRLLAARAEPFEGGPLRAAVITVPAMFQLAQCEATRQAAALAGIEHAPLLQEPIAAAMAHSGAGHARDGNWLVYDLGGGTFDVSLVRARAGRLQVLDHDGDNQLGGKDFNRILARWAAEQIRQDGRLGDFHRSDPTLVLAFARLASEAERVRIRLSECEQESFTIPDLARTATGEPFDVHLTIERGLLESLIQPTLARTIALCKTLLDRNRLKPSDLKGIVLVGGPTRTPCVPALLARELGHDARHVMDPTTIVAAGAALFAATQKRPAALRSGAAVRSDGTVLFDLEYESMTTNPSPILVGRILANGRADLAVRVRAAEGTFDSGVVSVRDQKTFTVPLKVRKGVLNRFYVEAFRGGQAVPCDPASFAILHGLSVAKPPLSQSVGVMLADNSVCWYLRKGDVLPARNTVTHATTIPLPRGQSGDAIKVPLVQGESERGDRNTVIGILCIHADHIARDLPAGAAIEVTLGVDEFSQTTARAYVPLLDQWFDQIIQLSVEGKNADKVAVQLGEQQDRLRQLEQEAEALQGQESGVLDARISEVEDLIAEGDRDSVDQADQLVRLMTRQLDLIEGENRVEKIRTDFAARVARATDLLESSTELLELQALESEFQTALARGDLAAAETREKAVGDLIWKANLRRPEFWKFYLEHLSEKFKELNLLDVARKQFADAEAAKKRNSMQDMIRICLELLALLPQEERKQLDPVVSNVTGGR